MGETQDSWEFPQMAQATILNNSWRQKKKRCWVGAGQLWEVTRKSTVNWVRLLHLSCCLLHWSVSYNLGKNLQMEISFINVSVPYKRITSTRFSELLLCWLSLKTNQLKIILMPKRHFKVSYSAPLCFLPIRVHEGLKCSPIYILSYGHTDYTC